MEHDFEHIGPKTMLLNARRFPPGGEYELILLAIEDITDRKRLAAAVATSEVRYRRLFEAARDGILLVDPDTRRITDANPFMVELLGYPRDELVGKELWEIGLLADEQASREAFAGIAAGGHHPLRGPAAPIGVRGTPRGGVRQQHLSGERPPGHPVQHPRHHRPQAAGGGARAAPPCRRGGPCPGRGERGEARRGRPAEGRVHRHPGPRAAEPAEQHPHGRPHPATPRHGGGTASGAWGSSPTRWGP